MKNERQKSVAVSIVSSGSVRPPIVYAPREPITSADMLRVTLSAAERDLRDFQTRYKTMRRARPFAAALDHVAKALREIESAKAKPRALRR